MQRNFLLSLAFWLAVLPFPAFAQMGMMHDGMSQRRHQFVMTHGIDSHYTNKRNPLAGTANNIAVGKKLYDQNCAACHGKTGPEMVKQARA